MWNQIRKVHWLFFLGPLLIGTYTAYQEHTTSCSDPYTCTLVSNTVHLLLNLSHLLTDRCHWNEIMFTSSVSGSMLWLTGVYVTRKHTQTLHANIKKRRGFCLQRALFGRKRQRERGREVQNNALFNEL